MTQDRPTGELIGSNLFECFDALMKNGSDAGCPFSARNTPEHFGRDTDKRNTGPFQLTNKFSRQRNGQEFFAVEQRLDGKSVVYRCYEVTHAFNEEEAMLVAIAAVVLKFTNSSEGRCSF
jgi:hypothetical protein